MSHTGEAEGNGSAGVKINDRRRFDMEGNVRNQGDTVGQGDGPEAKAQQRVEALVEPPHEELERLRSELEAAQRRVDELARAYQALDRDREDFKSRLTRERERLIEVERGTIALTLLEAIDELDLCLKASSPKESALAQGVRLIRDNILKRIEATGVERMHLEGQPFDPNLAEASDMELTPRPEDDQRIVAELRAGYRLKDRVIRPARVRVAKYVEPAQA